MTVSLNLESKIYIQKYGCGHCRNSFKISHDITISDVTSLGLCNLVKTGPRSLTFLGDSPVMEYDAAVLRLTWTRTEKTPPTYPAELKLKVKMSALEHGKHG